MESLNCAQRLGVRMARVIEPRPIVIPGGGDHERIALPMAYRVAHEIGIGIGGQVATIEEDLPVREVFTENHDQGRSLNDFQKIEAKVEARAEWQTVDVGRAILTQVLLAYFG